ncbi:cap-specific mRNA (nucleoside-2'-O-)-methyltransferase 2-like [Haematobia irritans]|uniref:cap-specific mRNA (nucleoside-2'-O-)-methyltransferase 2-like n=1 Tax=Haematobia irritans TaxID=7368 RepID=UPI003F4F62AA
MKPTLTNRWSLPACDNLFTEYYQIDSLQQLKIKLNEVKSILNDYVIEEWSLHTRRKDPAGEVPWRLKSEIKAEFVTIAWCKIFECLNRFPSLVTSGNINSLHLCEAPGAFIAALNHYLYSRFDKDEVQWKWLATTLNPYYEGNPVKKMIMDDRFILYTLDNWLFHKDFTGNIIDNGNIEHMKEQCQRRMGDVHLITADGSIDCIDAPDCQEEKVAVLHFAEIIAALEILAEGGSFVVKLFTLFEASSISKLYLLNCAFKEVHVFKPCTSKRGNSEVYVICLNYQKNYENLKEILAKMKEKLNGGNNIMWPLFPKACMPSDFLMQHEIMCRLFMTCQINAIDSNIYTFEIKQTKASIKRLQALRTLVCDEYFKRYKVKKLPEELKILYKYKASIEKAYKTQIYHGSHSEREMLKETTKEEQIFKLRSQLNDLEKTVMEMSNTADIVNDFNRSDEKTSLKLTLYYGQQLEVLQSSLFANVHLFVMRSKLNEFHNTDVLWLNNPQVNFPQENITCKFNDFNYSEEGSVAMKFSQQQKSFFKTLIENLIEHKPKRINFTNMPFLTHYAASILRYLSLRCYDKLTFVFHPSFEIVLEGYSLDFLNSLEELNIALNNSADECDILCFINILQLHHNDFNKSLTCYNNMLLLHNFKSILDH